MIRHRKNWLIVLFGGACILTLTSMFLLDGERRERYETFLLNEYKRIPMKSCELACPGNDACFPDLAAIQDYFMTLDPALGYVPAERLKQALTAMKSDLKTGFGPEMQWISIPAHTGGRTRGVMFDPNDTLHRKLWAGAVTGGLWFNDDFMDTTSSWYSVSDLWPGMAISCIVSDPNDPQTFYVGTGEPQTAMKIYRESSGVGFGIYRSRDAGETWVQIPSTEDFKYITDIVIRDENGQSVIYAGVVSGLYQGIQQQSHPTDGLYRSDDEGETWEQVLPTIQGVFLPYAPSDIEITSGGRIFVGTMPNLLSKGGSTILWSDSGLKGTWQKFIDYAALILQQPEWNLPGRVMLASAHSSPNRVYAVIASGIKDVVPEYYSWYGNYIIRSDDHGETWTQCNLPDDLPGNYTTFANIAWHALTIGVDPNNPDYVYVGGLNIHRSTNAGQSWTRICMGNPQPPSWNTFVHVDEHAIIFEPGSSGLMVTTNDGGVFYSDNVNEPEPSFSEINRNYNTLQFYTCAIGPDTVSDKYLAGTQDDGTLFYEGVPLTMNSMVSGGDGAFCCFHPTINRPLIHSAFFNSYFFYPDGIFTPYPDFKWTGTFINPADYDYLNETLYANAVTFDQYYSGCLVVISGVPGDPQGRILNLNTGNAVPFTNVKVSQYSGIGSTTLFLGTQSGRLYKVRQAQTNPLVEEIGANHFPAANIICIDIGRSEQEILVIFSNFGVSSVWLTRDGGATWKEKEGNLPDIPVRWGIFHPENTERVMLATELGVWFTENIFAVDVIWEQCDNGLPNVRTDMIRIRRSDHKVLAATHGRGLFTTTFPVFVPGKQSGMKNLRVYPNPVCNILNISTKTSGNDPVVCSLYNCDGKLTGQWEIKPEKDQIYRRMDVTFLPNGVYLFVVDQRGYQESRKIIIHH